MKNSHSKNTELNQSAISLRLLINSAIGHLTGIINKSKITIDNCVSSDLGIYLEQNKIATVIYDMMAIIISNARNTTISITADRFRDIIIVNVEDRNNYNGYALSFSLMSIEADATKAGGSLCIHDAQKKVTTVSFSFPNIAFGRMNTLSN
jgi:hypothetical protein